MADRPEYPATGKDQRLEEARRWMAGRFSDMDPAWEAVQGDASFRRYFRMRVGGHSRILMDAPPDVESSAPFLDIARRLRGAGLHAPDILEADLESGFLLLEDLGDELYRDLITPDTAQVLFDDAFDALAVMACEVSPEGLPAFDRELYGREMGWFTGFYLGRHRGCSLDTAQQLRWQDFCESLISAAMEQPEVFVHKDVHSCNLLRTVDNSPGIIDFQDAVRGPLTYDFVSLVWDRYIAWPRDRLVQWMEQFRRLVNPGIDPGDWVRWCDLMGLQRNLKIVGRFALLFHDQGRRGYVEMIPRFYSYVLDTLAIYPEYDGIRRWLKSDACAP